MRRALFAAAVALVCAGASASPRCSINDATGGGFAQAVTDALKAAPDCDRAYAILAECQLGSSGDNALSDIVVAKCEPAFKAKANALLQARYVLARKKCERLALDNSGSLYQSFAALCLARAARDFSHRTAARR